MSTTVFNRILDFMKDEPVKHITAGSVIYKGTEEDQTISKDELLKLTINAIRSMKNIAGEDSERFRKISNIPLEFECAYETICSLRDIKALKTSEQVPLDDDTIKKNIRSLQGRLLSDSSPLSVELYQNVKNIPITNLTWEDPLASRVISDDSIVVKKLSAKQYQNFMKPARNMATTLPDSIQNKCHEFVSGFSEEYTDDLCIKLMHNGKWKESDETLIGVTQDILDVVADVWMNPAFGPELMKTQSEGTYVTDVIIPSIRASLKGLPHRQSAFISTAERQSIASADRKGDGYFGKRPDFMYLQKREGKIFELVFGECSRLLCSDIKKREDEVKLWRETNDGMFWVRQGCKPEKDQFGIVGIQVAGTEIQLNVLIRDNLDIHRYYHLKKTQIPIQWSDPTLSTLPEFVELLLNLRNILVVNLSLLMQVPTSKTHRVEKSTTVSSPREETPDKQNKKRQRRSKKTSGYNEHRKSAYF
ncbi:9026_t:CDS:2 [Ambispora leptoticha]|uniref:9026_t:CDS:1 n=1 Tax=Ambispora leptoticha TaxID=144679 RepID=A0A9N8VC82_9GLOM|nr:9026_t:CDS:2 [Ambispora leptoticha]